MKGLEVVLCRHLGHSAQGSRMWITHVFWELNGKKGILLLGVNICSGGKGDIHPSFSILIIGKILEPITMVRLLLWRENIPSLQINLGCLNLLFSLRGVRTFFVGVLMVFIFLKSLAN